MRKIYLIPTLLAPETSNQVLPAQVKASADQLNFFFVEEIRTARRFLSEIGVSKKIEDLTFFKLDKTTKKEDLKAYLKEVPEGENIGILSEAGCPCIADPGTLLVNYAHEQSWEVVPLVGPSSILLALIASGFNGQSFTFHGYLPIEKDKRVKAIKELEKEAITKKQTQLFMETPYRNNHLFDDILANCSPETSLCIAANITAENQIIKTKKIKDWKSSKIDIYKQPTIFVLGGY